MNFLYNDYFLRSVFFLHKQEVGRDDIKTLYETEDVLFEQTILKSDHLIYSLCYVPKLDCYDIVIENYCLGKLVIFESRKYISNTTKKYFNLYKGDDFTDFHKREYKCLSHIIEYK